MLTPLTPRQQSLIVNNVVKACGNIEKLNKTGYKFIMLASGFIAHYDLYGFRAAYSDGSLARDIRRNARNNQWTNFSPSDPNYDYYMSKRDTYNKIVRQIAFDVPAFQITEDEIW
jgi:hypothetical protein